MLPCLADRRNATAGFVPRRIGPGSAVREGERAPAGRSAPSILPANVSDGPGAERSDVWSWNAMWRAAGFALGVSAFIF